jgi:putative restriction endonuclease
MQFDYPVFKVLAANDTSAAAGHQGGIVIPKILWDFFPPLTQATSVTNPTREIFLTADLFSGAHFIERIQTRYQHQTWGGKRSPEGRLTSNLNPLRDLAKAGDIVLFSRNLEQVNAIKIELFSQSSEIFAELLKEIGQSRFGILKNKPVSNLELKAAEEEELQNEVSPFILLSDEVERKASSTFRIARSVTFRANVLNAYDNTCALTGRSIVSPNGSHGLDAAHIVPLASRGSNDVRNGLAFSKEIHWAFDQGLFGFLERRVIVPERVRNIARNQFLRDLVGKILEHPKRANSAASEEALNWHRENIVFK